MAARKSTTSRQVKDQPMGFEKALERLEKIVAEMEAGDLGLEDMIARFEEGQRLIKFCGAKLNEVEKKIEVLVDKGDPLAAEPLDPDAGDGGDSEEGGGKAPPQGKAGDASSELF